MENKNIKEFFRNLLLKTVGTAGALAIRILMSASGTGMKGEWGNGGKPCIYALWHNRQLLHIGMHRDEGLCALASASRDGDYIAAILEKLGYYIVRGSTDTNKGSYKKSLSAARSMIRTLKSGRSVAVTVDGPLGPKYSVQHGVIFLARMTGCPIIPTAAASSARIKLGTWDNFEIPLPFGRIAIVNAEPYTIPGDSDQEAEAEKLRQKLIQLTEEAEKTINAGTKTDNHSQP